MSYTELLAPAGNFDCLRAAVQSGADAVYFAGKNFGARSYAQNFSEEEIKKAIDYCHIRGVKTHITVNTAYSDDEIPRVLEFVNFLYKEGADALIVSDIGLISQIKRYFPQFSVHSSTQMTIHNLEGVKFAEGIGADRVVLSRELPFEEIEYICNNSDAEIEIFVHGALCMCYSGQCLLSSMIGGRSGNRGSCAQPCRLPFETGNGNKKFILSLKDMSLVNHISKIRNSKVCSLKIEGRMKGAQYVAAVVSTYRKYIDSLCSVSEEDKEILERIFYRGGLTDGYFMGDKGVHMFAFEKPDNPYLKQSKQIISDFDKNYEETELRKKDVDLRFSAEVGKNPVIFLKTAETEIYYTHNNPVQVAKSKPADKGFIETQFLKTGGTPYNIKNIDINIGDDLFFSKSELNEIRRNAISVLEEELVNNFKRSSDFALDENSKSKDVISNDFTAFVTTKAQLKSAIEFDFKRIYVSFDILESAFSFEEDIKNKIVLSLPEIVFDSELEKTEKVINNAKKNGIKKLLVNNLSQLKYSKDFEIILSHRFNIWNGFSLEFYSDKYNIESAFLSPELSLKAIRGMNKKSETELIVYGYIPVMITENCIIKNADACPCNNGFVYITDRMGAKFPVKKADNSCRSILYNSVPIYLADKKDMLNKTGCTKNLYFTVETEACVKRICSEYFENEFTMPESFTRGRYLK